MIKTVAIPTLGLTHHPSHEIMTVYSPHGLTQQLPRKGETMDPSAQAIQAIINVLDEHADREPLPTDRYAFGWFANYVRVNDLELATQMMEDKKWGKE